MKNTKELTNDFLSQFSSYEEYEKFIEEHEEELTAVDTELSELAENLLNSYDKNAVINSGEKEILGLVINDEMNLNTPNVKLQDLKADIGFAQQGGEAFSSFLGGSEFKETADELKEDDDILSSMAENLAMVNKVSIEIAPKNEVGAVVDRTLEIASLNLSRDDLQLILNLVNEKININEISHKQDVKSTPVSEIMFNMLAESMRNGKAFRLNFDNDISVIIRVSKEGRISANFLPGSDIAENYLKNNMANLVQRFEAQGIEYDELTHQKQKRDNEQQNKKDKKNE
jgi:hypothetical protein